jgi:hypothetical protein
MSHTSYQIEHVTNLRAREWNETIGRMHFKALVRCAFLRPSDRYELGKGHSCRSGRYVGSSRYRSWTVTPRVIAERSSHSGWRSARPIQPLLREEIGSIHEGGEFSEILTPEADLCR